VTVSPYPPVDLQLTTVTCTDTTSSGQGISVGWAATNAGTGTTLAGAWSELVYLSVDTVLDGADYFLGSTVHGGTLVPGAGYSNGLGAGIPNGFSGVYHVIVVTDPDGSTGDIDLSNNTRASAATVSVRLQPAPDLVVSGFAVPPGVTSGQSLVASWTVANMGEGVTLPGSWTADFYLSTDPYLDGSDVPFGSVRHDGALAPGASANETASLTMPGWATGPYFVIARVDGRNEVYEAGREFNSTRASDRIDAVLAAPSDLVVRDVLVSPLSVPGEPVTVTWTLANDGDNPAVGTIENAVYVSSDAVFDATDPLVTLQSTFVNVPPHSALVVHGKADLGRTLQLDSQGDVTATLPGVPPGLYHAVVRANTRNSVRELALDNNVGVSAAQTQVDVAELPLETPVTVAMATGATRYFRVHPQAGIDLRVSLASDHGDATNQLYVALDRVPRPGDFDVTGPPEFTSHPVVIIPSTLDGAYYVMIESRAVPAPTQAVTVLAHALPFSITSLSPAYGGRSGTVSCDLRGAGLRGTTHVYLSHGGASVTEAAVEFVNTTELRLRWDLTNVTEDLYDVVAVNGDSTAVLDVPFNVQSATELTVGITPEHPEVVRGNGTGYYAFRFRNESNHDVPHLRARVAFPANSQLLAIGVDPGLRRRSDLHGPEFTPIDGDVDVVRDPGTGELLRVVDFEAAAMSPGEERTATIGLKDFLRSPYSVRAYAEAMESDAYLDRTLARFEAARLALLARPGDAPADALALASNAAAFAEAALDGGYVATGLVTAAEREAYRTAHGGLTTTGATGPEAPRSLLAELASGNGCSIPGASPECHPSAAPLETAIPACIATLVDTLPADVYLPDRVPAGLPTGLARGFSSTVSADSRVITPCDPNIITGPVGFGTDQFVGMTQSMYYRVDFSNDFVGAQVAAQVVKVLVPLDPRLNPSSVELGPVGILGGQYVFTPPADGGQGYAFEQFIPDLNLVLRVTASITGPSNATVLQWTFESLDPVTLARPTNRTDGFLPVNTVNHRGEAFLQYLVRPYTTAVTGDTVKAAAAITFDDNTAITTSPWKNRIDTSVPASVLSNDIQLMPGSLASLHWHGSDTGTGVQSYTLFASLDAGPFTQQVAGVTDTAVSVPVVAGHRYQFYTQARDNTNNIEPTKRTGANLVVPMVGVPGVDVPRTFALYPAYPNPARAAATFRFDLPVDAPVRFEVFDVQGRRVAMPVNATMKAGRHQLVFRPGALQSGIYFYRLTAARFVMTRKLTLVR